MDCMTEKLGVVGLGYVGLPLALAMTDSGYNVIGVDIDPDRIDNLKNGDSYVNDISDDEVAEALDSGFEPTTEYDDLSDASLVSVCVPTPLRKTGRPDVSYVVSATESIAECITSDTVVVLESTVYPGCTSETLVPIFEENGFVVGEDVYVAFSPERIDPGNEEYPPTSIPKVLGGVTEACGDAAESYYSTVFDEIVGVGSATEAEMVKLLENTFRAVNIGLINELAMVANELEVDIWSIVDAAATKPFGFMPFYPGPGLGGHCIPVDPLYLSWKANQQGIETEFIELADKVNREMPRYVVNRTSELLNSQHIPIPDSDVLVVGVAYKPDVSDTRESPAVDIIGMLTERGANVEYHDPWVPCLKVEDTVYESRPLYSDAVQGYDCVIIATDHSNVDYEMIADEAKLVLDTRNALGKDRENVCRL